MKHILAALLLLAASPRRDGFTVVTKGSGVEAIIEEQYQKHPKWWLSGLSLVDLDGDGHLDLFLSAHGGGGALAALNDGKGHFTPAAGSWPSSELHVSCDINEDGKQDVCATYMDGGAQWFINTSKPGTLSFEPASQQRPTNTGRINVLLDIDRDGKLDWLRSQGPALVFDLGDGKGGFAAERQRIPVSEGYKFEYAIIPADIDGDGNIDLILEWGRYTFGQGKCRILHNDGNMKFADVTEECGLYEDGLSIKGVGDFNHDGAIDLIAVEKGVPFSIFLNDGKGHFKKKEDAIKGIKGKVELASWGIAVMTDFDNDGKGDLIVNGKHFLKILKGAGDGTFTVMNKEWGIADVSAASVDDGICFGDIDGDGRLDIIGYRNASEPRKIDVYRNELPKRHWLNVRPVGPPGNRAAAGAKIRLYAPGTKELLWYEEVAIFGRQEAQSYYAHNQTERHFGLGDRESVDVAVEFYPSKKTVEQKGVKADQTVVIREE